MSIKTFEELELFIKENNINAELYIDDNIWLGDINIRLRSANIKNFRESKYKITFNVEHQKLTATDFYLPFPDLELSEKPAFSDKFLDDLQHLKTVFGAYFEQKEQRKKADL